MKFVRSFDGHHSNVFRGLPGIRFVLPGGGRDENPLIAASRIEFQQFQQILRDSRLHHNGFAYALCTSRLGIELYGYCVYTVSPVVVKEYVEHLEVSVEGQRGGVVPRGGSHAVQ